MAEKWLKSTEHLVSKLTHSKKTSRLKRLAYPHLGKIQITDIKSSDFFDVNHLETAHRLHSEISSIFAYAIVHNYTNYDPASQLLNKSQLKRLNIVQQFDPKLFGQLLRDIQNYQGTFIVLNAFKLSPLLLNSTNVVVRYRSDRSRMGSLMSLKQTFTTLFLYLIKQYVY
ncbi:MAG: phage integrase central domain-containing protein [Methylococcales bacterium]